MIARTFTTAPAALALGIVVLAGSGACIINDHGFEATQADASETLDGSVDGPVSLDASLDASSDGATNDAGPGRILLAPNPVTVSEGMTNTVDVSLDSPPVGGTEVTCTSTDPAVTVPATALVFLEANYSTPQSLTLTAPHDPDVVNEQLEIQCGASDFQVGVTAVMVSDDDTLAIVTSQPTLLVNEGQVASLGVSLSHAPAGNVTVTVASGDNSAATVTPAILTFTPANYNTVQIVNVNGVSDADTIDDTTLLTLSSTGLATRTVPVTVSDDD